MLDLFSADMRRNPFPVFAMLRATSPVVHVEAFDMWLVLDFDGVKRALSDHDSFSSDLAHAGSGNPGEWFIFFDPPRHTKLRALITKAFVPRVIANLEPRIRTWSRELLDRALEASEVDLATQYSVPLPMRVIAELLGVPAEDWPRYKRWSDGILAIANTFTHDDQAAKTIAEFRAVTAEMRAALPGMLAAARSGNQTDLLSRLVAAELDGERLTEEDILGFLQLLLVAGQETTANLINNAVLCLIDNPDQLARLRANPELLPTAIEEVLRFRSPVQWIPRATKRDVEMHGHVIPAGKLVLPMIGSANRDPQQVAQADRFDIARDPNPHLAFGHGIHSCLGAPLARLEAHIALTDFLERVEHFELASDEPWEPRHALHVHGPTRLPLRVMPKRRVAALA
jgi:cytochrome P450